jgi:hypothetical protein
MNSIRRSVLIGGGGPTDGTKGWKRSGVEVKRPKPSSSASEAKLPEVLPEIAPSVATAVDVKDSIVDG